MSFRWICVWMEGSFSAVNRKTKKKIIFHQLPAFNDDTGTPPPGPEPPPRTQHTHIQASAQGRDMTRVTHSSFSFWDKWERLLHGKARQHFCMAPLFLPCVSSVSRLCTQGSSSLQSRFSCSIMRIMCVMCTGLLPLWTCRGCHTALGSTLQSVCWWWWVGWVNNTTGPFFFFFCHCTAKVCLSAKVLVRACVCVSERESRWLCVGVHGVCFVVFCWFIGRAWESRGKGKGDCPGHGNLLKVRLQTVSEWNANVAFEGDFVHLVGSFRRWDEARGARWALYFKRKNRPEIERSGSFSIFHLLPRSISCDGLTLKLAFEKPQCLLHADRGERRGHASWIMQE